MINDVIKGMAAAIDEEFNELSHDYDIYDSRVPQDIEEPAFYIQAIDVSTNLFRDKRYLSRCHMVVHYFPENEIDFQEECNAIGVRLYWALEWIMCPGENRPLHGFNSRFDTENGVLMFFIDYEYFLKKVDDVEAMETLTQEVIPE